MAPPCRGTVLLLHVVIIYTMMHVGECSKIVLTSNPDTVKEGFTRSLTLKCSLQKTPVPAVGRDVTTSNDNILNVNSIIITRENAAQNGTEELVAQIVMSQRPNVYTDKENLQVAGNVSPVTLSGSPYLELLWTHPGIDQSSVYKCEINTLDLLGHAVTFERSISIGYTFPSDLEMLKHIVALEDEVAVIIGNLNSLEMGFLDQGVVELVTWDCSGKEKEVHFCSGYSSPPVVDVGVIAEIYVTNNMSACSGLDEIGFTFNVVNITTTGFKIRYTSFVNSGLVQLRWTSYPPSSIAGIGKKTRDARRGM